MGGTGDPDAFQVRGAFNLGTKDDPLEAKVYNFQFHDFPIGRLVTILNQHLVIAWGAREDSKQQMDFQNSVAHLSRALDIQLARIESRNMALHMLELLETPRDAWPAMPPVPEPPTRVDPFPDLAFRTDTRTAAIVVMSDLPSQPAQSPEAMAALWSGLTDFSITEAGNGKFMGGGSFGLSLSAGGIGAGSAATGAGGVPGFSTYGGLSLSGTSPNVSPSTPSITGEASLGDT